LTGLAVLAFLVLTPFLVPLVWAGVLAYASWPLAEWIRAHCGGRDTLAASLAVGLAALTLFAPPLWLGWVAQQEVGVLGGLLAFGLVGLFAGPIVLAVAWAVWREWTAHLDEDAAGESP
jgi:predicted PurR-regulated permease PerM